MTKRLGNRTTVAMLHPSVGMESKPSFGPGVNRVRSTPGPTSEARSAVVIDCLTKLLWRIHNEGTHLKEGRADGSVVINMVHGEDERVHPVPGKPEFENVQD